MGIYRGYAARGSEGSAEFSALKIAKKRFSQSHRGAHSNGCAAIACDAVTVERAAAAPPPPWS